MGRLLRIIILLVSMKTFASVKLILDTIAAGSRQLGIVFTMFAFFVCLFGIFGMQIFPYSFRTQCVMDERMVDNTACASDFGTGWGKTCNFTDPAAPSRIVGDVLALRGSGFAGSGYDGSACKIYCFTLDECKQWAQYGRLGSYCSDDCVASYPADDVDKFGVIKFPRDRWGRVHSCAMPNAYCKSVGNPYYGLQNFDNIGGFIPTMLQVAVPDASYNIIHRMMQVVFFMLVGFIR
jgi:hypothetical protein